MERFWVKVAKGDGCWLWQAAKGRRGYGVFQLDGRARKAHQVAYELSVGPIPSGKILLHVCDEPSCVRPSHLRPGTQKENVADMDAKGRRRLQDYRNRRSYSGPANPNAKLTAEQVSEIRRRLGEGESLASLGRAFGVTPECVGRYKKRPHPTIVTAEGELNRTRRSSPSVAE